MNKEHFLIFLAIKKTDADLQHLQFADMKHLPENGGNAVPKPLANNNIIKCTFMTSLYKFHYEIIS